VQNGVINIRIEGNYRRASALVETVAKPTLAVVGPTKPDAAAGDNDDGDEDDDSDDPGQDEAETDSCDWSYVQEWRRAAKRYWELFRSYSIIYFLIPHCHFPFLFLLHCCNSFVKVGGKGISSGRRIGSSFDWQKGKDRDFGLNGSPNNS